MSTRVRSGTPASPPAEAVVLLDAQQHIVAADAAAIRLFDHPAATLPDMPFGALLAAPSRAAVGAQLAAAASGLANSPLGPQPCTGQRRDGSRFPIDLTIVQLGAQPADSGHARCVALLRDRSAGTGADGELQVLRSRLRTVVELAPIAIWFAEGDAVVHANRAAARLVGSARGEDLVGLSLYGLLHADGHDGLRQALELARLHAGEARPLSARLLRLDGEHREVEIMIAALPEHGSTTVQMVVTDVTQRNRELRALERSQQALRRLSANVVEAREDERRRLARELHDELGQGLSALKMEIAHCASSVSLSQERSVGPIMDRIDGIVQTVRRITHDLRPPMLDDLGLADALSALAGDFSRRTGVPVHLDIGGCDPAPPERVTIALYRMVQEALTNIGRHAGARQALVALHRDGDAWVLEVRDDGVGLEAGLPGRDSQFGLLGMRERATMLGGAFEIANRPEGGVRLQVRLPVEPPPRGGTRRGA